MNFITHVFSRNNSLVTLYDKTIELNTFSNNSFVKPNIFEAIWNPPYSSSFLGRDHPLYALWGLANEMFIETEAYGS